MSTKRPCPETKCQAIATGILVVATLTIGTFLSSNQVSADDSIDDVSISVPVSCSMSGTGMNSHTTDIVNGQYTTDIGATTIKMFCNDQNGFAVYAAGYTGDEIDGTNSTRLVGSNTNSSIITGTATSAGSTDKSNWAMKLTASTDSGDTTGANALSIDSDTNGSFSSYHKVPGSYVKVAHKNAATSMDSSIGGATLTTTYAAYISQTQPADTYSGKVKYTLVHPSDASAPLIPLKDYECFGMLCYAPNTNDTLGTMVPEKNIEPKLYSIGASPIAAYQNKTLSGANVSSTTSIAANSPVTLIAPNYYRPGYGFAGWSTEFDATTATNPTIYGPNETFVLPYGRMILYPVWIASTGDIQNWNGCSNLTPAAYNSETGKIDATLDSVTALTDTRDGNVYAVARLADGKCWMIENLRLGTEGSQGAANTAKAQGYGVSEYYGNFIGLAEPETRLDSSAANSLYSADGDTPVQIDTWPTPDLRMPRYNNNNTNVGANAVSPSGLPLVTSQNNNDGSNNYEHYRWYSYGNMYTLAAAMANTGYFSSYSSSDAAGTSICPSGWRLPLGVESTGVLADAENDTANRVGSYSYLNRIMGGTGTGGTNPVTGESLSVLWRSFPNNTIFTGEYLGGGSNYRGSEGVYKTSSIGYAFSIIVSNVYPATSSGASSYYGGAIRCITD